MKAFNIQQEILLSTNTSISRRQLFEKKAKSSNNDHLNAADQLEEACWNGMLGELMPGMIEKDSCGKDLYLWRIYQLNSFLVVDLCEVPASAEKEFSIDPYNFLSYVFQN